MKTVTVFFVLLVAVVLMVPVAGAQEISGDPPNLQKESPAVIIADGPANFGRESAKIFIEAGAPDYVVKAALRADDVWNESTTERAEARKRVTSAAAELKAAIVAEGISIQKFDEIYNQYFDAIPSAQEADWDIMLADSSVIQAFREWLSAEKTEQEVCQEIDKAYAEWLSASLRNYFKPNLEEKRVLQWFGVRKHNELVSQSREEAKTKQLKIQKA